MKKIIYAITKIGKKENTKYTGVGYIDDKDILIACAGKQGKPYIRVFGGAVKNCGPILDKPNEFRGAFADYPEVELTDAEGRITKRVIEIDYLIWYKLAE